MQHAQLHHNVSLLTVQIQSVDKNCVNCFMYPVGHKNVPLYFGL